MAYITTTEVREIRNALKEAFPKLKFGVKKQHYSSVNVTIKKGNVDFSDIMQDRTNGETPGYADVNHYHLYQYGEHTALFEKIDKIIKTAPAKAEGGREWYDKSDAQYDHFDTAFYYNIKVGSWDKPYELAA